MFWLGLRVGIWSGAHTAVENNVVASYERGFFGAEPEHGFRDLHRFAEAADGMLSEYAFADLGIAESALGHRCFDDCGADGVDANPFSCVFQRGGPGETDDAMFTGNINSSTSSTHQTRDGRHIHDGAGGSLLQHLLNFEFQAQPRSLQIDIDDLVPIFFSLFNDGFPIAFDACVVESDVETSEFFDGFLDQRLNIGGFCSVRFDEETIAASSANEVDSFVAFGFAASGDD